MADYVIYSAAETEKWGCVLPMFWNKNSGWVGLRDATIYTDQEVTTASFPKCGQWQLLPESVWGK